MKEPAHAIALAMKKLAKANSNLLDGVATDLEAACELPDIRSSFRKVYGGVFQKCAFDSPKTVAFFQSLAGNLRKLTADPVGNRRPPQHTSGSRDPQRARLRPPAPPPLRPLTDLFNGLPGEERWKEFARLFDQEAPKDTESPQSESRKNDKNHPQPDAGSHSETETAGVAGPDSETPSDIFDITGDGPEIAKLSDYGTLIDNKAGGDCLFYALEPNLKREDIPALRQAVANVRHEMPEDTQTQILNSYGMVEAFGQQPGIGLFRAKAEMRGRHSISNKLYAALQAVPGVYASDHELMQWTSLGSNRDKSVLVITVDKYTLHYRNGGMKMIKMPEELKEITPDIVLYQKKKHWQRVVPHEDGSNTQDNAIVHG